MSPTPHFTNGKTGARPKAHRGSMACPRHISSRQVPTRKMGMTLGHWSLKAPEPQHVGQRCRGRYYSTGKVQLLGLGGDENVSAS